MSSMTPREIVSELDKHIIGQHDGRDQTDKGDGHEENLHCLSEIPINVDDTLTQ